MDKIAQLFVLSAAALWGMIGIFSRQLTAAGFSFPEMMLFRNVFTATLLFLFLFVFYREKLKIDIRDIWLFVCVGTFGGGITSIVYFNTMELIPLAAAAIILNTAPYMVMIMSALIFKEKITLQKVCALVVAFTGCVMTVGLAEGGDVSPKGALMGLLAAFLYSLYTIFSKFALRKYDATTLIAYGYLMAGIIMVPFSDFGNLTGLLAGSRANLMNLLFVSLFITLLPHVFYAKGLKRLEPGRASILAFFEPVTSAIAGVVYYKEMLSAVKILGMALIFISIVILNWKRREVR